MKKQKHKTTTSTEPEMTLESHLYKKTPRGLIFGVPGSGRKYCTGSRVNLGRSSDTMRIYKHQWEGHETVYFNSEFGFCKLNLYQEPNRKVAELYDLVVYPEFRGQGKGKELLDTAIKTAEQEHCTLIVLWPDAEKWVEEWYGRNGFVPNPNFININFETGWVKKIPRKK